MSFDVRSFLSSRLSVLASGALLAVTMAATSLLAGCSGAASNGDGPTASSESQSLSVCEGSATVEGLDVSKWDGTVDWNAVHESGRSFAFARVSDGLSGVDETFATNWSGIKAAGMIRGVYQFYRAGESGTAQADVLLSTVGTFAPGDLPPVLDVEVSNGQSASVIVAGVVEWIARIKSATGLTPYVYTMPGFWNGVANADTVAADANLWIADWDITCPVVATGFASWQFWQYSDSGTVAGIGGATSVDLNRFNGTLAQLQTLANMAATPVSSPAGGSGDTLTTNPSDVPAAAAGAAYGESTH